MTSCSEFYEGALYKIQDEALKSVKSCATPFYLTGGTALSRGYFNHRYSDDLDLFVNDDERFSEYVDKVVARFISDGFFVDASEKSSETFRQVILKKTEGDLGGLGLKVDFVNDIPVHFGTLRGTPVYYRTDSLRNILSNKYTAIYRFSAKDIVDICEISTHCDFNWRDIIEEAERKEEGIDIGDVVKVFNNMGDDDFARIKWTQPRDLSNLRSDMRAVAADILNMRENSLGKGESSKGESSCD